MIHARDADLDGLLSKQAIYEIIMRYCRGVNRHDLELLASVFHDDAVVNAFGGRGGDQIARDILASVASLRQPITHFVGNVLIEVAGDHAICETYFVSTHQLEDDDRRYTRARSGRYVDRFERRAGRWGITERLVIDDWSRLDEVVNPVLGADGWTQGEQGSGDPSYRLFTGL